MSPAPANNPDECKSLCLESSSCVAFTFVKDYYYCMRHTSVGEISSKSVMNSFMIVSGLKSCFQKSSDGDEKSNNGNKNKCIKFGFAFAGTKPTEVASLKTFAQCKSKCSDKLNCAAFTFVKKDSRCLMFDENHTELRESNWAQDKGWESAVISCFDNEKGEESDSCLIKQKTYAKGLLDIVIAQNAGECANKCKEKTYCAAFTVYTVLRQCLLFDKEALTEKMESSTRTETTYVSAKVSCFFKMKDPIDNDKNDHSPSCLIKRKKYAIGLLDTVSAGTFDQCARSCKQKTDCVAFSVCTLIKRCLLFDSEAFTKSMESSTKTRSYISAELKCYYKKGDNKGGDGFLDFEEDACMNDNRRIWSGRGSIINTKRGVSSYYGCKNLCEKKNGCRAFSLCTKTHSCVLFKEGYQLKSETVELNWISGVLECYNKQGKYSTRLLDKNINILISDIFLNS